MDNPITATRATNIALRIKGHDFALTIPEAATLRNQLSGALRTHDEGFMAIIKHIVSEGFKVPVDVIDSHSREDSICRARHAFFVLAREEGFSTPAIGQACGGRDHGTVLHGCTVFTDRVETIKGLKDAMNLLRKRVQAARESADVLAFVGNQPYGNQKEKHENPTT